MCVYMYSMYACMSYVFMYMQVVETSGRVRMIIHHAQIF